ncbi:MAG: class I SAM-dependent methyltransferase [Rubrivivax sp.]
MPNRAPHTWRRHAPWPLPALAAWSLAWLLYLAFGGLGAPVWLGLAAGAGVGLGFSLLGGTRTRARVIAAGFPLSLLASGAAAGLPAWAWLLPLALLWLLYPRHAWRDAPLFPTPPRALDALPAKIALPPGARVLDAGCGLGHGLRALRRAYPRARLEGVEGSWPLVLAARALCRYARVQRADMWTHGWAGIDLVYLFQRPESMPRALAKAQAEMTDGSWIASLEFEDPGWLPQAVLSCPDGRPLWLYRLPLRAPPRRRAGVPTSSGAEPSR